MSSTILASPPPFDLIIVGGGGAGLCAALEANERGLRSLVLEADSKLGGATALSSGVIYAAGGISIANAVVFGRLIGETVAADLSELLPA